MKNLSSLEKCEKMILDEDAQKIQDELTAEVNAIVSKIENKYNTGTLSAEHATKVLLALRDQVAKSVAGIEQDVFYGIAREKGIDPLTNNEKEIKKIREEMKDELPYFEETGKLMADKKKFSGAITHHVNMSVKGGNTK